MAVLFQWVPVSFFPCPSLAAHPFVFLPFLSRHVLTFEALYDEGLSISLSLVLAVRLPFLVLPPFHPLGYPLRQFPSADRFVCCS